MNNKEINELLARLEAQSCKLEEEYIENGGEETAVTEWMQATIDEIHDVLQGDGIDSLGRWLANQEARVKILKAEKDGLARKIEAGQRTIEYIKYQINKVLVLTDAEKVKGNLYSFARYESVKTDVDKALIKERYQQAAEDALRAAKAIPEDITVTLGASVKLVPDEEPLPDYYKVTRTPSCRFVKPRAKKEE